MPVLDETDRGLISALRLDGRMGLAALGAHVGLSGDAVRERLRRLTADGVVQVTCSVDPHVLGFHTLALMGLNVSAPSVPIAEALSRVQEFDLVACTGGRYDLFVEAVCRDENHLLDVIDRHVRSRGDVATVTSFMYLEVLKFEPAGVDLSRPGGLEAAAELSQADLDVIAVLQSDGRASYQDIADRTGMSYQMARRRAKALLDAGAVRSETVVNRLVEGTAVVAGVGLRTSGPVQDVAPRVVELAEVEVAVMTTGPFDMLLDVACRDVAHLAHVVGHVLPSIPGVEATETTIYQRFFKLPQSWSGLVRQL